MAPSHDPETATENSPLLHDRRFNALQHEDEEARSLVKSAVSKEEAALSGLAIGERLPYNDYTTIDWLHDLVMDSYRWRSIHLSKGLRYHLLALADSASGWIAAAVIGVLTVVVWIVDVAEATVSDWELEYCKPNPFLSRETCCKNAPDEANCEELWKEWSRNYWACFAIYVGFALAFGIIGASAMMLTKSKAANGRVNGQPPPVAASKSIYMAAGSGIPEIKTILSGFVMPHFLDLKVLIVKAFGAVFAVATGMCLGKEGPFVHISTCIGYLVANLIPKSRENGRKIRRILSAACASGLSVAFGAPIGGVLFSYEEISTYFPRPVLWKAFLCSLFAAMVLKALNPTGTGKLVLFETDYGTTYAPIHYLIFVVLGAAGGIFGGTFCPANYAWSKWFRKYSVIKNHPVFEVVLVALATALLRFPNILIRDPGDTTIKMLLVDCRGGRAKDNWVCRNEARADGRWGYVGWLVYGCVVKSVLTIVTFGVKVPSGVIIPSLDAGALFGRIIGQWVGTISPGIFAMVGAGAFLAGVSSMTISLCVIMFEVSLLTFLAISFIH